MHTVIVMGSGVLFLGFMLLTGSWTDMGVAKAALIFIPFWLVLSLANLWLGVRHAGYSITDELPIFLAVFGSLAALALIAWWFFKS
jgi:hypothetical protein